MQLEPLETGIKMYNLANFATGQQHFLRARKAISQGKDWKTLPNRQRRAVMRGANPYSDSNTDYVHSNTVYTTLSPRGRSVSYSLDEPQGRWAYHSERQNVLDVANDRSIIRRYQQQPARPITKMQDIPKIDFDTTEFDPTTIRTLKNTPEDRGISRMYPGLKPGDKLGFKRTGFMEEPVPSIQTGTQTVRVPNPEEIASRASDYRRSDTFKRKANDIYYRNRDIDLDDMFDDAFV